MVVLGKVYGRSSDIDHSCPMAEERVTELLIYCRWVLRVCDGVEAAVEGMSQFHDVVMVTVILMALGKAVSAAKAR